MLERYRINLTNAARTARAVNRVAVIYISGPHSEIARNPEMPEFQKALDARLPGL